MLNTYAPHPVSRWLCGLIIFGQLLCASLSVAQTKPSAEELELSLKGSWIGALEYRDYQSGQKFELPMTMQISVAADNATITRVSAFDDGPKTGIVYITTISLFDAKTSRGSHAVFRKGRAVDVWTDDAKVTTYKDTQNWTIVYQHQGTDDSKPADIRITQSRAGSDLIALKEVKSVGTADTAYVFRNQVRLKQK